MPHYPAILAQLESYLQPDAFENALKEVQRLGGPVDVDELVLSSLAY